MPQASISLSPRPASVGMARRWLAETFESWDLFGMDYDVSVVLSELVTNAVLHAATEVTVRVFYDGSSVRLEVEDGSAAVPRSRRPTAQATTGRGLLLVGSLTTGWGYSPSNSGKVVWAEFNNVDSYRSDGRGLSRSQAAKGTGRRTSSDGPSEGRSSPAMRGRNAA